MKLTLKQTKAIDLLEDSKTTELLFGGGAGGGKSALGCFWLIVSAVKYPGTRWLMGRSKLKTLKQTTLATFFEVAAKEGLRGGNHYTYKEQKGEIQFKNGSLIILKDLFRYPSDPNFDSLGSLEITGAFIDECNQITEKAKSIVKSRIRFRLDESGLIPKLLMSCNPAKNWVFREFYEPFSKGALPQNRAFIQSLLTDNPHISAHYRESLADLDKIDRERLLYGNWNYDNDPARLIEYDACLDLFSNSHVRPGVAACTADVARFGSDKFVCGGWRGFILEEVQAKGRTDTGQGIALIEGVRGKVGAGKSQTIVDEDGLGGGVVDIGGYTGFVNGATPIKQKRPGGPRGRQAPNYKNLAAQCAFILADMINKRQIWIRANLSEDVKDAIIQECQAIKRDKPDSDGKLAIIPKKQIKEDIGRSPDYWDMMKMRILPTLKRRVNSVSLQN